MSIQETLNDSNHIPGIGFSDKISEITNKMIHAAIIIGIIFLLFFVCCSIFYTQKMKIDYDRTRILILDILSPEMPGFWRLMWRAATTHKAKQSYHFKRFREPRGIVIAKTQKESKGQYICSPESEEYHTIAFAPTGVGKTTALLIPTCRAWKDHIFAIDVKGDIYRNCKGYRRRKIIKNGKQYTASEIIVIDPEDPETYRFDVFGEIRLCKFFNDLPLGSKERDVETEIHELTAILMPEDQQANDSAKYYQENAASLLEAYLVYGILHNMTFVGVVWFILNTDVNEALEKMWDYNNSRIRQLLRKLVGEEPKYINSFYNNVVRAVELYSRGQIKELLTPTPGKTIKPRDIENFSIFLKIPFDQFTTYLPYVQLLSALMLRYCKTREAIYQKTHRKILLALDEFSSLSSIPGMSEALTMYRSFGVRVFALTQDIAKIKENYGDNITTSLLQNFQAKIVMGSEDPTEQKYLSDLLGKKVVKKSTQNFSSGSDGAGTIETEKEIISPAEVGLLQRQKQLIYKTPNGYEILFCNYFYNDEKRRSKNAKKKKSK